MCGGNVAFSIHDEAGSFRNSMRGQRSYRLFAKWGSVSQRKVFFFEMYVWIKAPVFLSTRCILTKDN